MRIAPVYVFLAVACLPGRLWAIGAFDPTPSELALLPPYCALKALHTGNDLSIPEVAKWSSTLGRQNYLHLHHYCDALLNIHRADMAISNKRESTHFLIVALENITYSQNHSTDDFVLLPEMAWKKGQVLERLGRDREAVDQYQAAIKDQPSYVPAYASLSDYYLKVGKRAMALEVIRRGLKVVPDSSALLRRQGELVK